MTSRMQDLDKLAEQAKELAEQPVLLPDELEQQAPLNPALTETHKRWTTFIVERIPQLTIAHVGHLTDVILNQGFTNPMQLTFMTTSQLEDSRSEWTEPTGEPITDSSWELVLQLRRAPEPSPQLLLHRLRNHKDPARRKLFTLLSKFLLNSGARNC